MQAVITGGSKRGCVSSAHLGILGIVRDVLHLTPLNLQCGLVCLGEMGFCG